jgi:predicted flap endonuclease-1-like 5' DNA nuclease
MLRKLSIMITLLLTSLSLTGFAFPASSMAEEEGIPWLLWIFVIVVLAAFVAFLVWWWMRGRDEKQETSVAPPARLEATGPVSEAVTKEVVAAKVEETVTEEPASPPPEPDDLKMIEGIGPKISGVLQAAGITTFAQLAEASIGQLEQILEEANPNLLRLAKPGTWPEQAQLAAEGKWEELEKLQDDLHGGQRR